MIISVASSEIYKRLIDPKAAETFVAYLVKHTNFAREAWVEIIKIWIKLILTSFHFLNWAKLPIKQNANRIEMLLELKNLNITNALTRELHYFRNKYLKAMFL